MSLKILLSVSYFPTFLEVEPKRRQQSCGTDYRWYLIICFNTLVLWKIDKLQIILDESLIAYQ